MLFHLFCWGCNAVNSLHSYGSSGLRALSPPAQATAAPTKRCLGCCCEGPCSPLCVTSLLSYTSAAHSRGTNVLSRTCMPMHGQTWYSLKRFASAAQSTIVVVCKVLEALSANHFPAGSCTTQHCCQRGVSSCCFHQYSSIL